MARKYTPAKQPKTKQDWMPLMGCSAWFNAKDGFLVIAPYATVHSIQHLPGAVGHIFTVVGQKGRSLLVSADMRRVETIPKKYTRVLPIE